MAHDYNGYRVESARLAGWDYRTPARYFITFCTKDHMPWLGRIIDAQAHVSPIGLILAEEWLRTPYVRPNVELDHWVIMPNHFHGILAIVDTPTPISEPAAPRTPGMLSGSVGAIVGQIKAQVTKRVRALGYADFGWQSRFHDHVIRNDAELQRVRDYMIGNPGKWYEDRYYVEES